MTSIRSILLTELANHRKMSLKLSLRDFSKFEVCWISHLARLRLVPRVKGSIFPLSSESQTHYDSEIVRPVKTCARSRILVCHIFRGGHRHVETELAFQRLRGSAPLPGSANSLGTHCLPIQHFFKEYK